MQHDLNLKLGRDKEEGAEYVHSELEVVNEATANLKHPQFEILSKLGGPKQSARVLFWISELKITSDT